MVILRYVERQNFVTPDPSKIHCINFILLNPVKENILKYLEKCQDLKVLKFEFKPEIEGGEYGEMCVAEYPFLSDMVRRHRKFQAQKFTRIPFDWRGFEQFYKFNIKKKFWK